VPGFGKHQDAASGAVAALALWKVAGLLHVIRLLGAECSVDALALEPVVLAEAVAGRTTVSLMVSLSSLGHLLEG
jgi:hypothetical protein